MPAVFRHDGEAINHHEGIETLFHPDLILLVQIGKVDFLVIIVFVDR